MATLEKLTATVDKLQGSLSFKEILKNNIQVLERGRRKEHDFVFKTNMRTIKSGPNKGKIKVDGAVLVMFGNKHRDEVQTAIVRKSDKFLTTLDQMANMLSELSE